MRTSRQRGPLLALTLIALLIRLPGVFTDFWLDEVWSHSIALTLHRPMDVLLSESARIDNNHPLMTLWMAMIGAYRQPWLYRLPSLLAGTAMPWLAWRIARRMTDDVRVAWTAAVLVVVSFPLAFYASEARGYSMAVCFAFAALDALLSFLTPHKTPLPASPRVRREESVVCVFNAACLLGLLSHLTFIPFLSAMMLWSVLAIRRREKVIARQLIAWGKLFALPALATLALYHWFIRTLVIGGAAPTNPLATLIESTSLILGGPLFGAGAITFALIVAGLFFIALIHFARSNQGEITLFLILGVVVMPGGLLLYDLLLSQRPQPLMPRYFLIPMAVATIAIARAFVTIYDAAPLRTRSSVVFIILASVMPFNAVHWQRFASFGRGKPTAALVYLARNSATSVRIAASNPFGVGSVIRFAQQLDPELTKRIEFTGTLTETRPPLDIFIITDSSGKTPPGYSPDRVFPAGELSGTTWRICKFSTRPAKSG